MNPHVIVIHHFDFYHMIILQVDIYWIIISYGRGGGLDIVPRRVSHDNLVGLFKGRLGLVFFCVCFCHLAFV